MFFILLVVFYSCVSTRESNLIKLEPDLKGLRGEVIVNGKVVSIKQSSDYAIILLKVENRYIRIIGKVDDTTRCKVIRVNDTYEFDLKLLMTASSQRGSKIQQIVNGLAISFDFITDDGSFITIERGSDIFGLRNKGLLCIK